jgi:hypothetical protein
MGIQLRRAGIPQAIPVGILLVSVGGVGTVVLAIRHPVPVSVRPAGLWIGQGGTEEGTQRGPDSRSHRGSSRAVGTVHRPPGKSPQEGPGRAAVAHTGCGAGQGDEEERCPPRGESLRAGAGSLWAQPQPPDSPQLGQT